MHQDVLQLLVGVSLAAIVNFLLRQIVSAMVKSLLDPLISQFFVHAKAWAKKEGHSGRSTLKCPDCEPIFKDLPN